MIFNKGDSEERADFSVAPVTMDIQTEKQKPNFVFWIVPF